MTISEGIVLAAVVVAGACWIGRPFILPLAGKSSTKRAREN
jgi:hypothetical protein